MDREKLERTWIPHIRTQFERGRPILFTGAGFSSGAKNLLGEPIPIASDLKQRLWALCYPGSAFEESCSLQDLYEDALGKHRKGVTDLLLSHLTPEPASLPEWYREIFSMPWCRAYTLNVDDIENAVSYRYDLPRKPFPISAIRPTTHASGSAVGGTLECVHLNGTMSDIPDYITFSTTQYAERLNQPDPWYVKFAAELLTNPVIFIGTKLDEPPLWQHLTMRHGVGGPDLREFRQRSYLVTPILDRARQALLGKFNVVWLDMTAQEFVENVLRQMNSAAATGLIFLSRQLSRDEEPSSRLYEVSELAASPSVDNAFLLGDEPVWGDLQYGKAITREVDTEISATVESAVKKREELRGLIVITGTAGSGKSTSLMRVVLRLSAEGTRVGWVDRLTSVAPNQIRSAMRTEDPPSVLAIDDADMYGDELARLVRGIAAGASRPLILLSARASRVDRVLNPVVLEGIPVQEISMPMLCDTDIGALISLLERERKLGILTGKPRKEQEAAFREQAGRQLLVAMIQATSGRKFEEKAFRELLDLPIDAARVYGVIAVATSFRFGVTRDEILIATGEVSNFTLNEIDQLVKRHIVTLYKDGFLWARHRVIADIIRDELAKQGQLIAPVRGLAVMCAAKAVDLRDRNARVWRALRALINHEFLNRVAGPEPARNLYGALENVLGNDYHFWLQRGSLEVEFGDLRLAEHYLNTALGLMPDDPFVQNEYAYLLFRKAIDLDGVDADQSVKKATEILEDLMVRTHDYYPYHVLGSQGLSWARRGIKSPLERGKYLGKLMGRLEQGCKKFPRLSQICRLYEDIKKEYMMTAVSS